MKTAWGVIAAGHPATAQAAEEILREGGNAFDAIVAAHFAACVAEPVLCSLAGGGFLLGHRAGDKPIVYDFFVQTPRHRHPLSELDFFPILADFGTTQQEFHIGVGSIATPGCVKGLFRIHQDLCTMPMQRLVEPAIALAKEGIQLDDFQAYIFGIVQPIYLATPEAGAIFANPDNPSEIISAGQRLYFADQADLMDVLAREGADLFYRGEITDFEHYSPFIIMRKVPSIIIIDPPVSGESRGYKIKNIKKLPPFRQGRGAEIDDGFI